MKRLSQKQFVILSIILLVLVIGIVLFFVVTYNKKGKDSQNVSIAVYTAKGDKKFVLAEVEKTELTDYYDYQENRAKGEVDTDESSVFSFVPTDPEKFFREYVNDNQYLVCTFEDSGANSEVYTDYLFLFDNECFLLGEVSAKYGGGYNLIRCWLNISDSTLEEDMLCWWPGADYFFKEADKNVTWNYFDENYGKLPVHSFEDLVEFYERIDSECVKIDAEKQEIYVKGIDEATGKMTDDYYMKLVVSDEGILVKTF